MKHTIFVILASIIALLAISFSATGITWLTYREDVTFTVGTVDLNHTWWGNATTTNITRNVTLPCNVSELTNATTNITIRASGGAIALNLSVNSNGCNGTTPISDGDTVAIGLDDLLSGGKVLSTHKYLNFTWSIWNATNQLSINITGNDCSIDSSWISNNITIKEYDKTTPEIKTALSSSFFTVNDSINISHSSSIDHNLTDLNLTTVYPSHNISTPDTYIRATEIVNGSYQINYTVYQKRGPYTYDIDEEIDGRDHEVTIYVKSEEVLTNCVDWTIDPDDDFYDGYFDTVDNSSLVIKINGVKEEDWDRDGDNIEMTDLTVRATHTQNKFVFTWTVPAVVAPAAAPSIIPGLTDTVFFAPFWIWIVTIIAVITGISAGVVYIRKK